MYKRLLPATLGAILLAGTGCAAAPNQQTGGVKITETKKGLRVSIAGEPFTEYITEGLSRPALYPLLGPGQIPMTRTWPFDTVPDEEHDHPHHLSVWFAHGAINGLDFWSELPGAGKTVQVKVLKVESTGSTGIIQTTNQLIAPAGKIVATDERTLRFYDIGAGRMFDFEVTMFASHGDLVFGDTKEGTMAMRIAESMRLMRNKKPAQGHIVLSTGARDGETWGKRAEWCEYHGPAGGKTMGIALFDHPDNLRHPTWWHVRDYGLLAANPFGLHDFEGKRAAAGNFTLKNGKRLTFRYRIYLHEGDEKQAEVQERYNEYKTGQPPRRTRPEGLKNGANGRD